MCREAKNSQLSFCAIIKDDEIYSLGHLNSSQPQQQQQSEQQLISDSLLNNEEEEYLMELKQTLAELEQKFLKIKDDLIKRQLHESDCLHAVQLMDWQSKLKQLNNNKIITINSDDMHVPMVAVNSKFELTPIKTC